MDSAVDSFGLALAHAVAGEAGVVGGAAVVIVAAGAVGEGLVFTAAGAAAVGGAGVVVIAGAQVRDEAALSVDLSAEIPGADAVVVAELLLAEANALLAAGVDDAAIGGLAAVAVVEAVFAGRQIGIEDVEGAVISVVAGRRIDGLQHDLNDGG